MQNKREQKKNEKIINQSNKAQENEEKDIKS